MVLHIPNSNQLSALLEPRFSWGKNIQVICSSCDRYLPGYYGLYNSLIMNGFEGSFMLNTLNDVAAQQAVVHDKLKINNFPESINALNYHPWIKRWYPFLNLPDGDYMHVDLDIIFERPFGWIEGLLDQGLILAAQPDYYQVNGDVLEVFRANTLGIDLPINESLRYYINGGMMLFRYPRDRPFVKQFVEVMFDRARQLSEAQMKIQLPFLDQNILNIFYQKSINEGKKILMITPDVWEFGGHGSRFGVKNEYWKRAFPWVKQSDSIANRTYIIHGAALHRPWLWMMNGSDYKSKLYRLGIGPWVRRCYKHNLTPYERAWVYYAGGEDRPIPFSAWGHYFPPLKKCLKNPIWRSAFQ